MVSVSVVLEVMSGTPCVAGTRVPADTVLAYVRAGHTEAEIHEDYPTLPAGAVAAVIRWDGAGRPLPDTSEALEILDRAPDVPPDPGDEPRRMPLPPERVKHAERLIARLEIVLHELRQVAEDGWAPVDAAEWNDLPLLNDWEVRHGLLEGAVTLPDASTGRADRIALHHSEPLLMLVPEWRAALTTVRWYRLGSQATDEPRTVAYGLPGTIEEQAHVFEKLWRDEDV